MAVRKWIAQTLAGKENQEVKTGMVVKKKVVALKRDPRWPDGINITSGMPKATYGNALAAIDHMEITVQYDIFRGEMRWSPGST